MKMIIGGAVAFLLGIYTIIIFSASFFDLVLAVVPVTLILAGGLMVYLNRENLLPKKEEESDNGEVPVEAPVVKEPSAEELVVQEPVAQDPVVVEEPATVEPPVTEEPEFVGNTDSKVFHFRDCNFAQSKNCTDFFAKKEDAVQAGYKSCSRCKP